MAERKAIEKTTTVSSWLSEFRTYSTKHTYKTHLKNFFEFINKDPDKYILDIDEMDNGEKKKALKGYETDITTFENHLNEIGKQPKTIQGAINCVRVFLRDNDVELKEKFWANRRRRGNGSAVVTDDKAPDHEQLRQILQHADVKATALFLTLSSSGMRIGEALKVKLNDIKLDSSPAEIDIKATMAKNKHPRKVYISQEAVDAIKEWLKVRDSWIVGACKRCNLKRTLEDGTVIVATKRQEDDRLFPFETDTARGMWNRLIGKVGLDQKDTTTGRLIYHIHSLRKYFKTQFSKYNSDIAHGLMGHKGYLGGAYDRLSEREKQEAYLEGVRYLLVFSQAESKVVTQLREQLESRNLEVTNMKGEMSVMQNQIGNLNKEVERILEGASDLLEEKLDRKEFKEK